MDIKRMHDMIEKLTECTKSQFDKGLESVDTCEMGKVIDMIKDLAEAMYYRTFTKTMDESEDEEILKMFDRYGRDKRFYDHYRYEDGRFAPKGRGTYRRNYDEPMWHMTPEMYRDMDREPYGRMYYTEPTHMHDSREGKSGISRRTYMDTRDAHKANTQQDKEAKMHDLETYMRELSDDLTELIAGMIPEEKNLAKSKLSTLVSKM
ncbi:MAG: hypothetical protein KH381_08015 [Clostridium sp.]|nr:hypothetical protein [Clostridium sp.]